MDGILAWILMGLVLGLTDVFPISSRGHLALLGQLLNVQSFDLSLVVGLHSGSVIAIAIYFHKEFGSLWKNLLESLKHLGDWVTGRSISLSLSAENTVPYLYVLSLLPVAIEGFALRDSAEKVFADPFLPLMFLMFNGVIILITALIVRGERTIKELKWTEFLLIGMLQGLATIPGISRLGLVLCAGLWFRLKWQETLKLTFVLSIPVVLGALAVENQGILQAMESTPRSIVPLAMSALLAFLGSWLSLKLLTSRLLERRKLALFGYYCLMLGSFAWIYLYFWN